MRRSTRHSQSKQVFKAHKNRRKRRYASTYPANGGDGCPKCMKADGGVMLYVDGHCWTYCLEHMLCWYVCECGWSDAHSDRDAEILDRCEQLTDIFYPNRQDRSEVKVYPNVPASIWSYWHERFWRMVLRQAARASNRYGFKCEEIEILPRGIPATTTPQQRASFTNGN